MKKLLFLLCFPAFPYAQVKKVKTAASAKSVAGAKKKVIPTKPASAVVIPMQSPISGGFAIHGTISGYPEGTQIKMLSGQTGGIEQTTAIKDGNFIFTGKTGSTPEFKLLGINGQEPFIVLFIGNEDITLNATKDKFEAATATGSKSQNDYAEFATMSKPYEDLLNGRGRYDVEFMDKAATALAVFIGKHKGSYVTPLVVFRYNQLTGDYEKLESMYNSLADSIKSTPMGGYLAQLVQTNKTMEYGKPMADFSQNDTAGNKVSLSSFRGKYVLVDFWASWCGPCRAENPNVVNSYEKYKSKNFTVLGISLDREKQPWINAINNDHLNWTHVSDLQAFGNAVAQQFGINSIPQNFLLDPEGKVIGKNLRGAALEYKLSKVLK